MLNYPILPKNRKNLNITTYLVGLNFNPKPKTPNKHFTTFFVYVQFRYNPKNKTTIILSRNVQYIMMGASNMNLLKKLLNNYKQNTNRHQFENILQQACQYKMIELGN
jgi:hypothetical protein